jgi:hypothetical protein
MKRRAWALAAIAVVAIRGVAVAQISQEVPLLVAIDLSKSDTPSCRVETKAVDRSKVGEQLRAMGVPIRREIHIPVDKQVKSELLLSMLKSLQVAGYANIGFTQTGNEDQGS